MPDETLTFRMAHSHILNHPKLERTTRKRKSSCRWDGGSRWRHTAKPKATPVCSTAYPYKQVDKLEACPTSKFRCNTGTID